MERVSQTELLQRVIASAINDVHTSQPGEIVDYDASAQLATVRPVVRPGGEELPELPAVPVLWPRGGDGYLVCPLEAGDTGLIICCEVDIGAWRQRGQAGDPGDDGRHELAFAVFLPGLAAQDDELAAPSGATVLAGSDTRLGSSTADQKVLGGDNFETAHDALMAALVTWSSAVTTAVNDPVLTAATLNFQSTIMAFNTALENALSSLVKVKI